MIGGVEQSMSESDAYGLLIENLGFPGSARLRLIMEDLMTPEEARMVASLPGTPSEVAQKTGIDSGRVAASLDKLFFKGVVTPRRDFHKREAYRFVRSIGHLHDLTMATQQLDVVRDQEFFGLWYDFIMNEMYPASGRRYSGMKGPRTRIVAAHQAIKDLPGVLPWESFPELLRAQSMISVVPCSCRLCTASVGKRCSVHDEVAHNTCFQFGRSAEYGIARGSGKQLTLKEALDLTDIIEESGLLHKWTNDSTMVGPNMSCQCCRDCCMNYVPVDMAALPIGTLWAKSRYEAYVNVQDCTGCQACVDRCLFDAITMEHVPGTKRLKASVSPEKCFGCGVCVVGCKQNALKMKVVRPPEHIPSATATLESPEL